MLVKEKYGFLPKSVLYFKKDNKLTMGFLDNQKLRKDNYENASSSSMSEFNPDLCKFIIEYWSKPNDIILDPFHGWGTRACISKQLNRNYIGFDISQKTNKDVKELILKQVVSSMWFDVKDNVFIDLRCGDGLKLEGINDNSVDLIFTCPPYFNIEKYESCAGQLSDIEEYSEFLKKLGEGIKVGYNKLKPNKFCIYVVGDWRKNDELVLFNQDVVKLHKEAGFKVHDLLIHKLNSASVIGCGKWEEKGFVTKSHEYVLVFKK